MPKFRVHLSGAWILCGDVVIEAGSEKEAVTIIEEDLSMGAGKSWLYSTAKDIEGFEKCSDLILEDITPASSTDSCDLLVVKGELVRPTE